MTVVDVKGDVEHSIPLTDVPSQHSWILPAIPRPPRHQPGVMRAECLATPDVSAVGEKSKSSVVSRQSLVVSHQSLVLTTKQPPLFDLDFKLRLKPNFD